MQVSSTEAALIGALATVVVAMPPLLTALSRAKEFRHKPVARGRIEDAADMTAIFAPILLIIAGAATIGSSIGSTALLLALVVVVGVPFLVFALRLPGRAGEDSLAEERADRAERTDRLIDLLLAKEESQGAPCHNCGR